MADRHEPLPVGHAMRLLPHTGEAAAELAHGASPLLRGAPYPSRPYLALNMVASVDGRVVLGGSAAGLGSPTDQHLMRRLRADADAVLHGAGTLRADPATPRVPPGLARGRVERGLPPHPLGVVLTTSGELPEDHPFFTTASAESPRLVYAADAAARRLSRPGVEVVVLPSGGQDLSDMLADLRRRGVRSVLCEGGPRLNAALLALGAVDEIFLTLAPRLVGGTDPLTIQHGAGGPARLELRALYARGGELFLRYALVSDAPAAS